MKIEVSVMSRKIGLFILILTFVATPVLSLAAGIRTIHVEWVYNASAVSYYLYKDGAQVCVSNDPGASQMDCNVYIEDVPMTFTLVAEDADGARSPESSPYVLEPPAQDAFGNYIPLPRMQTNTTSGDAALAVSFDGSASIDLDGTIASYEWNFSDGETGSGEFVDHIFYSPGTYTVVLQVTDDSLATAESFVVIDVTDPGTGAANEPPVAAFTAALLEAGTSWIGFDAYSSNDPDGTIVSYLWNFGDGSSASGQYVEHEFLIAGDYNVVLTVLDDEGAASQDEMVITIVDQAVGGNVAPIAILSASSEQRLLHFEWDYPVDSQLAGFRLYQNGAMVCEVADPAARQADCPVYLESGTVRFWINAYNQSGEETLSSEIFTFDSSGFVAQAVEGAAPLLVHFNSARSYDEDGTIVSYKWGFGDGAFSTEVAPDHSFAAPGAYIVTLTVTDNAGETSIASTDVTVTGTVNQPPTAVGAAFSTDMNKSLNGILSGSDPDGDSLSFSIVANGTKGVATVTNSGTGAFTYVPDSDVTGSDSFTFQASDGEENSNTATISIDILQTNRAPVANDLSVSVSEDSSVNGFLTASDADGDSLTYAIVSNGSLGAAVLTNSTTGAFTYTPKANVSGSDSFTYKVSDGTAEDTAVVSVAITPVNDPPTAVGAAFSTDMNKSLNGILSGSDPDGDSLSFSIVANGTKGVATVTNSGTGAFTYVPDSNVTGSDSFTFQVSDGVDNSNTATVSIDILQANRAPVANDLSVSVSEDSSVNGSLTASDADGDSLTYALVNNGSLGSAFLTNITTGSFTYTPNANANGTDSFSFKVNDGFLNSNIAVVEVSITPVNDVPVAGNDSVMVDENTTVDISVLANDFDVDGDALTIAAVTQPAHGTVAISGNTVRYTPEANFYGSDLFSYEVSDGQAAVAANVALTVSQANGTPIAQDGSYTGQRGYDISGTLAAYDPDGDTLTFQIVSQPSRGSVSLNSASGAFVYSLKGKSFGTDSFTFNVTDGHTFSGTATISIEILR
jgi:PKD repeat protein